jgi:23S rRNA pseudouridine1911/1915/1917 synthase
LPSTTSRAGPGALKVRLRVPEDAAGERLDRFLAGIPEVGSRAAAERLLAAGEVLVDGASLGKSHRLSGGEDLELEPPAAPPAGVDAEPMDLRIPYEDEHLLVVDKPAGLVVHPAPGHPTGTLVHGLVAHDAAGGEEPERPGIVHRLDRDTSGLMILARSEEVRNELQRLIRRRGVEREYLALASGRMGARSGTIDAPLGRDTRERARMAVREGGRDARTHFEVIEFFADATYLRVRLETGRTHQVRVHLAAIGHPLTGDRAYGGASRPGLRRQFLHSARLAFSYSGSREPIDVASELPPDLAEALRAESVI